jgi:hypothetical protein
MSGRRELKVIAKPKSLRFTEDHGYVMIAKITDGPQHLVDRMVSISLSQKQLEAIDNFEPQEDPETKRVFGRIDLESLS